MIKETQKPGLAFLETTPKSPRIPIRAENTTPLNVAKANSVSLAALLVANPDIDRLNPALKVGQVVSLPSSSGIAIYEPGGVDKISPEFIGSQLIARYLDHGSRCEGHLHVRRSLDQFYYDTHLTDKRDEDQGVYKYTKLHQRHLKREPTIMMVDQLWLWVLQDAAIRKLPS
jgi:hypothetical protein